MSGLRLSLTSSGAVVQHVDSEADLPAAIAHAEQAGAFGRAYLMRQRLTGRIGLFEVFRDTSATTFKRFVAISHGQSAVVVVGADDGMSDGPEAWPLAHRMVRWANSIILHGAGPELIHYQLAVAGAVQHGSLLFIECESAALPAWESLILAARHRPVVLKIVPKGGQHPVSAPRVLQ
jgi:hypothetical protein